MAEQEFKLPPSSFNEIKKLLIAFAKSKSPNSLDDLNRLTGINKTLISSNNGFLESIGAIIGGNSKEATPLGKNLGLAIANQMDAKVKENINTLFSRNEFIQSMLTALEIKPRSSDDFQSHIAYSLGKELKGRYKTGTNTLIEMLLVGEMIEEKEGLLYPKVDKKIQPISESIDNEEDSSKKTHNEDKQEPNNSVKDLPTPNIVSDLGQNVTLNINIQLTIPDTDDEKVYENFFKAMKKNLLS